MDSKPVSRYHFRSQSIFTVDNEPLAVCVANDKVLVATVGHCVEVRSLDDHGRQAHTFCTVDLVKQILHSEIGQYVATLEVKASRQALMTHVRLYFNWHVDMKGLPMRARIAGRVTPSSQSGVGHLEMVELPLQKQACYISCCQSTGNLAVSCGFSVSLFYFCIKIHDISKLQFHDLEHIMEVYYTFPIKEVAVCEDFLACMSANEVHVVKIDFRSTVTKSPFARSASSNKSSPKQDIPRSRSSFEIGRRSSVPDNFSNIKDDPYFISWKSSAASRCQSWTLSPAEEVIINDWKKKLTPDSWPLTIHLPSLQQQAVYVDQSNFSREEIGPMDFFPGQPVKLEYTGALDHGYDGVCHQFDITSMVYRRFPVPPSNCLDHQFCLHSLQFLPLYISEPVKDDDFKDPLRGAVLRTSLSNTGNPLHSLRHHLLKHLEVFFSSPSEGFLYNLHGDVYAVGNYPYKTTSVCHVALESNILHAVTSHGIETYSLGCWDRILKHFQLDSLTEKRLWHLMNEFPFLLGTHPFLGIQLVTFENGNLLLLANASDGPLSIENTSGTWTVYALQCPLAEEFFKDLLEVIAIEEESDGHLVHWGDEDKLNSMHTAHAVLATEVLLNQPPVTSHLSQLFQEACCQLADLYFMSELSNVTAALVLYGMSGCSLENILKKVLTAETKVSLKRIYDFLSLIFIENHYNKHEELPKDVADAVVNIFAKMEPKNLSLLFLSGHLIGYDSAAALEHIQKIISTQKRVEDVITACILCTHIGMVDSIPSHLSSVTNDTLLNVTAKYPSVWLTEKDGEITFSSFLQVVQQLNPNVFVKIMQQLFFVGHLSPNIISLLCQSDWEDFGLAVRTDAIFMHFLEELLINKCVRPWHCSEAVVSLLTLYLNCLRNAELKNLLPLQSKPWNLFGFRRPWLSELPPFLGRSIHGPCQMMLRSVDSIQSQSEEASEENNKEMCSCSSCNDCLLRIQSLLCSDLAGTEAKARVLSVVNATPSLLGALSLQVLSSPSLSEAANVLLAQFPSALLEYCRDTFGNDSIQWQKLLKLLLLKAEQEGLSADEKRTLDTCINGVVSYLAEIVSPTELVIMLPQQQNARFLTQVKRCIAKHQSKNLHDIIVAKGYELKSLV